MLEEKELEYKERINERVRELIELDGRTIKELILMKNRSGIISLSLIPYIALYCRSVQEFFGEKIMSDEDDKSINDIRNGLKFYSEKYSKAKQTVLKLDEQQDIEFRNRLRFAITRMWNVHNNIGVFFDEKGHIIGNTQNMNYYINIPSIDIDDKNMRAKQVGIVLGGKVGMILDSMCTLNSKVQIKQNEYRSKFGYIDANTNRKNGLFSRSEDKELNLTMLHILSTIGFVEHVLHEIISDNNHWVLRVEYVVAHYGWKSLKMLKQHCENNKGYDFGNDISSILEEGAMLFASEFRNCMMHYGLCDKEGKPLIAPLYYDERVPFYGLIESLFNGQSCEEFYSKMRLYLDKMERYLMTWVNVDINKIRWDI